MKRLLLVVFLALLSSSCALRTGLRTEGASPAEVRGDYTVIFYGCNHFDDLETVVFLDAEGDRYSIEPYAPAFNYRAWKGIPAADALSMAERFVNCSGSYEGWKLSRILDPQGKVAGYELRPLYFPFTYGIDDVLDTFYWARDDKVFVTIKLKPLIENMLNTDGRSHGMD